MAKWCLTVDFEVLGSRVTMFVFMSSGGNIKLLVLGDKGFAFLRLSLATIVVNPSGDVNQNNKSCMQSLVTQVSVTEYLLTKLKETHHGL